MGGSIYVDILYEIVTGTDLGGVCFFTLLLCIDHRLYPMEQSR